MVACVRGLDDIAKYRRFKLLRPLHSVHDGGCMKLSVMVLDVSVRSVVVN